MHFPLDPLVTYDVLKENSHFNDKGSKEGILFIDLKSFLWMPVILRTLFDILVRLSCKMLYLRRWESNILKIQVTKQNKKEGDMA